MAWITKIPYRLIDFSTRIHPSSNRVIGVKRLSDVGGSGTWVWIDEEDNIVEVEEGYFESHPSFQFEEVNLEGNEMVSVPKFYVKSDGNSRYWISPEPKEGFHVHPAFMSKGKPIEDIVVDIHGNQHDEAKIYVGKWQSFIDYSMMLSDAVKMWSIPSLTEAKIEALEQARGEEFSVAAKEGLKTIYPSVQSTWWENWHSADAWNDHNPDGAVNVVGFHMMTVWELSALQWLALIEGRTTDVSLKYGSGWLTGNSVDAVDGDRNASANFHGIHGLWGNVWQWIQGIQTRSDGSVWIWDNLGNEVWKDTGHKMPVRKSEQEIWSPGETCGYWRSRLLASGYNYDTADMFLPDTTSLVSGYEYGCFADGVWCRTRSQTNQMFGCAIGGSYDSGNWGGLFGWNFDLRVGNEVVRNGLLMEEVRYAYPAVASRLCFAPVNLPGGDVEG